MKKFFAFVLAATLVFSAFSYAKAGPSVDQQHTSGTGSVSIKSDLGDFAQTFKPTYSRLNKVEIELSDIIGSKNVSIKIRHRVGVTWDAGYLLTTPSQVVTNGWNTFEIDNLPLTVSANESYGIYAISIEEGPQWKYSSGPSTYDRGFAIWQGNYEADWDFNFKTWGTDPVEIVAENTQATDDQATVAPATTTTGSTETLGATSSSIVKPTSLTAAYSATSNSIDLVWKASTTTDLDGYKIFRSESSNKNFLKIKEVTKDVTTYSDLDIAAGKTYYYQVRAYKATTQSVSSNTASASTPIDIAPAKPINFKVVDSTEKLLTVMWRKSADTNISGYTINLYKADEKVRSIDISNEFTSYSFLDLESATLYKAEIIAKNTKGLVSSPAIAYGSTELPEAIEGFINMTRALAAILVLLLVLILAFKTKQHIKDKN